ncbi:MAG TPA: AI-2E family transporter [Flavobacteriaceae bacterium]|nr:AI-2E family transporter [Flavobacteriaceae bacterium]
MSFTRKFVYTLAAISVGLYFTFVGLAAAKGFLSPIVTAIVLALLMIPIANKMESWGINRGFSSFFSTLFLMTISLLIALLVFFQIKIFVDDSETIKKAMKPKIERIENHLLINTKLDQTEINDFKEKADLTYILVNPNSGKTAMSVLGMGLTFLTNSLLMFVYIFFLLHYRTMFKKFILKLFSKDKQHDVGCVIDQTAKISQHYIFGRFILIVFLTILYSIGLGISGVSNFVLISIIAAVLSVIPWLGNIIGFLIALSFGFLTTGETGVLIGIILTFIFAQLIESFVLQPYVLGDKVNIHPLFVILVVILGNAVWGIIGMALAIPILGIINSAFNHIKELKPLGFLLSNPKEED